MVGAGEDQALDLGVGGEKPGDRLAAAVAGIAASGAADRVEQGDRAAEGAAGEAEAGDQLARCWDVLLTVFTEAADQALACQKAI